MTNYTPNFRDYSIRIWNDENEDLIGTYINADFNNSDSEPYHGIFAHISDDHLSIELGTHDEQLIAEAVSLCKEIYNNFLMLDGLLTIINEDNKLTDACFRKA